jgi:signal transduction histidine kinase
MSDLDDIRATLARIPNPIAILESLFALAPVGLQIYEVSGRSILVNQAFIELFGSEPPAGYNVLEDEIAEKNGVLDFIHRAFKGETVTMPTVWYDPRELTQVNVEKGNRVAMQATFLPLFDRAGKVSHVAIVFKDFTREMLQRDQLDEERELLAALVDQVGEGIIMSDTAGVLRLVNRAAREMGVRPGTPLEKWRDIYGLRAADGRVLAPEETPLGRALRGEPNAALVQHRLPDESVHVLNSIAVPLRRSDGSLRGAVVTFRDETERQRHEEEAKQTAHFRERFIGILGHDLRSPLTAILASAALLLRQRDLPATAVAAAKRVAGSAERMGRMISDLLDFTQARLGGGIALLRKPTDLGEVAEAVVDEVVSAHAGRIVTLDVQGDASGEFDPDRTAQLLSNLLTNALAYSPPDQPVQVELHGREKAVEITVSNAGTAIPPEEREVLFDPFRRGRTAGEHRGLGLGLFIVEQIARAHGGEVRVESAGGRTTFRALLQR